MSDMESIRQLLAHKPGLKAQQIADELGLDRTHVVTTLHGLSRGEVRQDNAYRWWPKAREPQSGREVSPAPRTLLASLCRYYLDCLTRESGPGVSLAATDTGGYVALDELPFDPRFTESFETNRAVKRLLQKVQRERGQLTLYIGYAIRVRSVSLKNEEETRIEPVLLYPIEEEGMGTLRPTSGIPLFNLEVLKTLSSVDSGNVIDEAIHLSEELGLASTEDDVPPWDEIILRLQQCRPEWGWKEDLNPYELSKGVLLTQLTSPGIYNRAVLFAGTRSPFTYGLEIELRKLAQLDEAAVRDTALGMWLRDTAIPGGLPEEASILEVLPLNTEQRQAVIQGLGAPLTVVTGPPGTGKSQVVTALLTNLAWQSRSALFSSKNNHAVDVVESRVNSLGSHPLLLRLGKEEHHARIAQDLTAALAESSGSDDAVRFEWLTRADEQDRLRFSAVQHQIAAVVNMRNAVDELERAAEPARALFGAERLAGLGRLDIDTIGPRVQELSSALAAVREPVRKLWDAGKTRRFERIAETAAELAADAEQLGVARPDGQPAEQSLKIWEEFHDALAERIAAAARFQAYRSALDRLRSSRSLEDLACELTQIAEESAHNSLELWQSWLRRRPGRWTPEQRRLLSEYVALLQMIATGDRSEEGAGRKVFRRYYNLFPEVTKILPCWAVTSLSVRGRLPFEAGVFDVVVIDEASQCDIASALPLLFRARRAIIIGDPLQLKHVSTVAPQQDRQLLSAHGLAEGHAAWAYSVNSLFDLARSVCRHEDIVNLREHHRSHRDIIGFSNRHFYRGGLRIATDHESLKPSQGAPAVRWIDVRGKVIRPSNGGALNGIEAEAVVAEVRKLILEGGYDGSIGVVTPFRAQANRIRTLVHQDPELARQLTALQFVVDTVHGFQGDERDAMFFSPVVSTGVGENTLRFLKSHGNLFNVAITRARSELVVVGDRQAALDSGVDYLASFAEYAGGLGLIRTSPLGSEELGPEYPAVAHPELVSDWERIFYKALYAAGLRPIPQYDEAPYILDFALFDGERKLDVEVDGEKIIGTGTASCAGGIRSGLGGWAIWAGASCGSGCTRFAMTWRAPLNA